MTSKSKKLIVARGTVFPSILPGAGMVHGVQIAPGNVKVCVDDVVGEYKTTPLPVPNNEHILVGDASGSFVQWPKNLILLGQDPIAPEKTKIQVTHKKVSSKGSATLNQKHEGLDINGDAEFQNLSETCKYLHDVIMLPRKSDITSVDKDSDVFKCNLVEGQPISVAREDIIEFLRMSRLNIPILQIFMIRAYVFNSLRKTPKLHIKAFLNVAYQVYVGPNGNKKGSMDSRMHWHADLQCPQQQGGTECGYYVMRYMYDIVSQYSKNGEANWTKGIGRLASYTRQEIDEIRDIWADYFTNEYV